MRIYWRARLSQKLTHLFLMSWSGWNTLDLCHVCWYSYIELPSCRGSFDWNNIYHASSYVCYHNHLSFIRLSLMLPLTPPLMLDPPWSTMLFLMLPLPLVPFMLIVAFQRQGWSFKLLNSIWTFHCLSTNSKYSFGGIFNFFEKMGRSQQPVAKYSTGLHSLFIYLKRRKKDST